MRIYSDKILQPTQKKCGSLKSTRVCDRSRSTGAEVAKVEMLKGEVVGKPGQNQAKKVGLNKDFMGLLVDYY